MIRPGALGAMFLVFAGTVLPAAAEEVRPAKPEITWSVMHPTAIDVAYMKRVVEKAKDYGGVDSFEACGDCHSPYGGINGLSMLEPYPHARAKLDPRMVEKARADLNAICELAHSIGKPLYYWHREVFLAKGLLEDRPEMLDENGEFDLLGKAYQDYLRFKIREAFRHCPKLDGVVLTLTEADYSVIHSAHPEKYPPQRVVEALVGLFAEEHERAGKRFILRSFGSNSRDYADIIGGARRAAAKHAFEIETKVTEADFVPWLPKNPFLRKSEPLRLGVECDALGEFLGAGYLPAAQVDRIREYVGYGREEGADRYVIRIDRVGNSIFDSAHEVNLYAYMRFIADPSVRSDQVVAEYAARRFGDAAREMAPILKDELELVRDVHYVASNLTFHSFPLKPEMKWLKAGGIYSVYRENADLSGAKDIWSILSWMRTPSHAQILAEKDAGLARATNALATVERLKGRMPADEYERQHRAFATAVLAARALRAYTRCVVAYFEDMADRLDEPVRLNRAADAAVAEIESMMTDVGDTFTGEGSYFATAGGNLDRVYFVGLRFYCRELVREYRLERAMRRKLERPDVYDFVIPGGIYDDNRTIRTMHGAHASAGSDRVVRYAGNDVFPNGTITVRLNAPKDARITVETDPAGASDFSLSKTWSNGVWTVVIGKKGPGYPGVLSVAALEAPTAFAAVDVESEEPVVRHGAAKLREFLARTYPSGGEGPRKVTVAVAAEKNPLTSRITVTDDGVRVTGATPREALQGCYRLMDELEAGDRPVLRKGTRTCTRMFSPRMVHSGYEIEKYTDAHMDEIARAGLDAILVYVNDPPDGTRNGREDFPALVKRAAEHGLDVYAYADFFWNPILVNPCDPGAEEKYEAVFGAIAKNAPGLKGIVCVGESCYFPERGEPPLKPGAERPDRRNGWTPTLDWAAFLRLVTKVTRKYSPGFDVVFWTYNWYGKPEKDRLALLEAIPTNVTVHVTFEMGNPACEKDGVTFHVDDYSITESGPGTTFVSEAEVCGRRGIPLTSMSNTGGRTWDFGGMPFEPAPYDWLERFRKLREARDRWGLKGLMDSHHYGFVPNVVADLAKAAFTCETAEGDLEPALRALAVREVGSAAADDLLATWRDWSDAFKWHSARGYDQYGPLRLGSSYPLLRPDEPFPPSPRPVYEYVNGKRNGNGWLYLDGRYSCPGKDLDGRIRTDGRELELLGRGNARLEAVLGKVPSGKAASARRMLGYGKYMEAAVRTLRNVRRYRKACREGNEAERRRILGEEEANVRGLLPWVEADPRLGFEPSMRYVTDPFMLKWKLEQLKGAY